MIIAIWVIAALLLGLWSLAAWGLHAVVLLGSGWVGDLQPLIDRIPYAELIDRWVPGWQDLLRLLLDLTAGALSWLGSAGPVLVWVVWGVGALLLLAGAGLLTLVVGLLRKNSPPAGPA